MNRVALAAVFCCAAPAFAQYGDPDAGKTAATAWKWSSEDERARADGYKAAALAQKAAYDSSMSQLAALRADISAWCAANGQTIPPAVYDQYIAEYDEAVRLATEGGQQLAAGSNHYGQAVYYYNSGLNLYVPYGYMMAAQFFYSAYLRLLDAGHCWGSPTGNDDGTSAYAKYLKARLDVSLAYSALWGWFSSVSQ